MGSIVLSILVNGLMAVLLIATLVYCRKLNARIQILQDSKSELAKIVREFDESTKRATESIAEIHDATARLSDNIQHKIDKANFVANDLEIMIERGGKMTGRTEVSRPGPAGLVVDKVRAGQTVEGTGPADRTVTARAPRARSRSEQELMNAIKAKDEA